MTLNRQYIVKIFGFFLRECIIVQSSSRILKVTLKTANLDKNMNKNYSLKILVTMILINSFITFTDKQTDRQMKWLPSNDCRMKIYECLYRDYNYVNFKHA